MPWGFLPGGGGKARAHCQWVSVTVARVAGASSTLAQRAMACRDGEGRGGGG